MQPSSEDDFTRDMAEIEDMAVRVFKRCSEEADDKNAEPLKKVLERIEK
jgi:hypothetical protein